MPSGLFARLALTLSLVLSLAMLTLGAVLLFDAEKRFNASQLEHASSQAKTLAEASLDALITVDYELLERWVVSVIPEKHYAYAYLAKSDGQVLTHSNTIMVARFLEARGELDDYKINQSLHNKRLVMEVSYPARVGDTHLANATVAYYLDEGSFFKEDLALKIAILMFLSLASLLGVTLYVIRKFTKPLSQLTNYISSTSISNRDFKIDKRLLTSWGEVGVLSRAFDAMIIRLLYAFDELGNEEERLKIKVEERTHDLNTANQELEKFSYSVSHDLRAPLRAVAGFSDILLEDYFDDFDGEGKEYLNLIKKNAIKMEALINDLLQLSRISRKELEVTNVDISIIATDILERYQLSNLEHKVKIVIENALVCQADKGLINVAMENLLGNAWKYSSKNDNAKIEFGHIEKDGLMTYFVKDNGAGFDMTFKDKLFESFQRLHSDKEFEGSGVGLATVARVIAKHKGKIWAEAEVGKGATFYFTLPQALLSEKEDAFIKLRG